MRGAPLHYSSPKHYKTYLLIFFWGGGGRWCTTEMNFLIFYCLLLSHWCGSGSVFWENFYIQIVQICKENADPVKNIQKWREKNFTKKSLQKPATTVIWTDLLFRLCNLVVTDLFAHSFVSVIIFSEHGSGSAPWAEFWIRFWMRF